MSQIHSSSRPTTPVLPAYEEDYDVQSQDIEELFLELSLSENTYLMETLNLAEERRRAFSSETAPSSKDMIHFPLPQNAENEIGYSHWPEIFVQCLTILDKLNSFGSQIIEKEIKAEHLNKLNAQSVRRLRAKILNNLLDTERAKINASVLNNLNPGALQNLDAAVINGLPEESLKALEFRVINNLGNATIEKLEARIFRNISDEACQQIEWYVFNALNEQTITQLDARRFNRSLDINNQTKDSHSTDPNSMNAPTGLFRTRRYEPLQSRILQHLNNDVIMELRANFIDNLNDEQFQPLSEERKELLVKVAIDEIEQHQQTEPHDLTLRQHQQTEPHDLTLRMPHLLMKLEGETLESFIIKYISENR
ncbi:hypothetical protein [Pseudochelatococcus sp. G4_1912]|uniref:hypothetical protein n=1 Tax=Pseudochelatococcus sp. G4_1912 TaxID=3114288 RepID=UPI0039C6C2AA